MTILGIIAGKERKGHLSSSFSKPASSRGENRASAALPSVASLATSLSWSSRGELRSGTKPSSALETPLLLLLLLLLPKENEKMAKTLKQFKTFPSVLASEPKMKRREGDRGKLFNHLSPKVIEEQALRHLKAHFARACFQVHLSPVSSPRPQCDMEQTLCWNGDPLWPSYGTSTAAMGAAKPIS